MRQRISVDQENIWQSQGYPGDVINYSFTHLTLSSAIITYSSFSSHQWKQDAEHEAPHNNKHVVHQRIKKR